MRPEPYTLRRSLPGMQAAGQVTALVSPSEREVGLELAWVGSAALGPLVKSSQTQIAAAFLYCGHYLGGEVTTVQGLV